MSELAIKYASEDLMVTLTYHTHTTVLLTVLARADNILQYNAANTASVVIFRNCLNK